MVIQQSPPQNWQVSWTGVVVGGGGGGGDINVYAAENLPYILASRIFQSFFRCKVDVVTIMLQLKGKLITKAKTKQKQSRNKNKK